MKSGVTLQQMLTEVKRQSESKEDYLIAPNRLRMESYGKEMFLHLSDDSGTELIEPMTITGIAHRQIGTHLRIPAAYYDRMREERPDLLAYNANTWFKQESSQRMLRTLDGSARAYLSNRYRRIDNIDIAGVTLPILGGLPDIRFESCQITESRMYIKAVNPRLQAEVSPGDIVQAGVIISNSEVGLGSVSIQPLIYRLVCSNGMVVNEAAARRNHVGRVTDSGENFSVYSQATLDAEDKALAGTVKIRQHKRLAAIAASLRNLVFFMGCVLLFGCLRLRVSMARSGKAIFGVIQKSHKLGGRQFEGAHRLHDLAVFFLLFLLFQLPDFGLPLGSLLPGFFQFLIELVDLVHARTPFLWLTNARRHRKPAGSLPPVPSFFPAPEKRKPSPALLGEREAFPCPARYPLPAVPAFLWFYHLP